MSWNVDKSKNLYGINFWSGGYFNINEGGDIVATPKGSDGPQLNLKSFIDDLDERGICTPVLLRFPDIVKSRIQLLNNCFHKAMQDCHFKAKYCGVYPIKVNQQGHLVEEIVRFGKDYNLGIECGSKPELLVALAMMSTPEALIVCNGFKDQEYIETALLSQKLGRKTFIVVDRMEELPMIIQAATKLNIKPLIGFRAKLNQQGAGRWVESSGARSKFGLNSTELVRGINMLKESGLESSLQLLHFHIGSQISSIQSIKASLKEAVRVYIELHKMGFAPEYLDVGGGLGIDYDASSGRSDHSTNYSEQEYANDVIFTVQSLCDEQKVPHPNIITESGRALVAHSAVLVFDVLGRNEVRKDSLSITVDETDNRLVQEMYDIYKELSQKNIREFYNDMIEKKRDYINMFSYGVLSLEQRAKAEDLYWAIATKIVKLAKDVEDAEDFFWDLEKELSDTYFCNFSVFQSLPDSWALGQIFPVMPIHRHTEAPSRRATLVDLTCDSDGKIEKFIDTEEDDVQSYLEVHDIVPGERYYIGAFLTGAYQEILGDLHNLFGDTNAVHVSVDENGYTIDHVVEGDSVEEVLSYVEYNKPIMIEKIRTACEQSIASGSLKKSEARLLMMHYQQSLAGYTYLEEAEEES